MPSMYPQGWIPDALQAQIDRIINSVGPTGPDWMMERCRELRRGGMQFTEAMAQAREELRSRTQPQ